MAPYLGSVGVEPISAVAGHGKRPVYHSADVYRRTNTHMHTSMGNLESPVNLTFVSLLCGRMLVHPEGLMQTQEEHKMNKHLKLIVTFTYGD